MPNDDTDDDTHLVSSFVIFVSSVLGNMNNKQIDALIREGKNVMIGMGDGLYFRIARKKASWVVKYTIGSKRSQIALPNTYPSVSISEAKRRAFEIRQNVKLGIDPKSERKKAQVKVIRTVDQLFEDWYQSDLCRNLKYPHIPARYYRKEMKKHIGVMSINDVSPLQIRSIIDEINASGRKSIANKTLLHAKQLFKHAIKLNLIHYNPAQSFTPKDAGGTEQSRNRALNLEEVKTVFSVFREQHHIFTRDNYLACCLLLCLGCRKGELISARWENIDFEQKIWHLIPTKKRLGQPTELVPIPLPDLTIQFFEELKVRSAGSDYVFPARRASKRRGYISDDTLNHALAKLFGKKVDADKAPYPNHFEQANIDYFTVHDLRRTFRTLLSSLGVSGRVAELCVNHKLKNEYSSTEATYDKYDFFDERKAALNTLSVNLAPHLA